MAGFLKPSANVPPIDGGQPFSRPWYDFFSKLATLGNLADVSAELTAAQNTINNILGSLDALPEPIILGPIPVPAASDEMIFAPVQYFAAPTVTLPSYGEDSTAAGTITGTIPGTGPFLLAHTPSPASSLALFLNGQRIFSTADFSLSGAAITTVQTVGTGDRLDASYRY